MNKILKTHFNIGTIGHIDHGKTTLTSALSYYLYYILKSSNIKAKNYDEIDSIPEEKLRGITIKTSHIEYESFKKHYGHIDCPGHIDYIKNMIIGTNQMDAAILVISALDGPMPQTLEHLLLINQIGIKNIVVYINKLDLISDNDLLELVELEITDLLDSYKYKNIQIIKGSALQALNNIKNKINTSKWYDSLDLLINTLDSFTVSPRDYTDNNFLLSIEDIFSITGRGTVVTGKIEKGSIKLNDKIYIKGFNYTKESVITGLESFKKNIISSKAGDNIGILLRGIKKTELKRGMCVIKNTDKYKQYNTFISKIYLLKETEGGRHKPILEGYKPQIFFRTLNITGEFNKIYTKNNMVFPGDTFECSIKLINKIICEPGIRFSVREGGKTIASGLILKTI